jgi:predicted acylesterase/phospholipase RssA
MENNEYQESQQQNETENIKPTIRHLVCPGGGHNGFIYYGILKHLNKKGFWKLEDIKTIYSVSAGSIFMVMLALNYDWDVLDDFLIKRPWNNVFKVDMYSIIDAIPKKGIFNIQVIRETFLPLFNSKDISIDITLKEFYEMTNIDFHICITEFNKFETVDLSHKTHPEWKLIEAVYASSALPGIFAPFYKDGRMYYDGGILMNYPIKLCIDSGIDKNEIFGIKKRGLIESSEEGFYENIEENTSIIDCIQLIMKRIFNKIFTTQYQNELFEIPNEIIVYSDVASLDRIISCSNSKEERIHLIDMGIELSKEFIENL